MGDAYQTFMMHFYILRRKLFPWWYEWRAQRVHRKSMLDKFGYIPGVGDYVEDCRLEVHLITAVDHDDPDTVTFEDGFTCSLWNCCDRVP